MKKTLITLMLLLAFVTIFSQSNIIISGENNAIYTHRTAKDSLSNYFENELNLRIDQRVFSFGMTFRAELPKYDQFQAIHELHPNQVHTEWSERFVQLNLEHLRLKAGTLEESFGSGIVLRAWNDKDNNRDKRLEGAQIHSSYKNFRFSGIYGALREDVIEQSIYEKDILLGADVEYRPFPFFNFGISAVEYKQKNLIPFSTPYTHHNIYGGRFGVMTDLFDLTAEYAELRRSHGVSKPFTGTAIYANGNFYIGPLTLTSGYKRYDDFQDYPLSDLPTLNHYDELLFSYDNNIKYEEGLLGEIRYIPNFENEFLVSYGESWNNNFQVRYYNLFAEYKRYFSNFSLTLDYEHVEKIKKDLQEWEKELKPSVYLDFFSFNKPMTAKLEWSYNEEEISDDKTSYNKPIITVDASINDRLSIAVFASNKFKNFGEIPDKKVYLGTEIVTSIASHTDLTLFLGKEQGGKVCRNGVCKTQAPFEGLKLTLTTRF